MTHLETYKQRNTHLIEDVGGATFSFNLSMASSTGSFETREVFLLVVGGACAWLTDDAPS